MRYEKYPDLIRFLRENTHLIISTFNKSGTRNLRILKHALGDFKKIYEMVSKAYPNTNYRMLQTMLIFTIAISFEIKAGKITKDKFVNIKTNEEYKLILVSSRVFMDNRQFYIKEFDNNYYYNFKSDYRFFKFIEMYVRTRIFDMKTFKRDMEAMLNAIDVEKLPAYKRLLTEEYWKISDDQFEKIIEEVLKDVKKGKLELIEIVKLFAYFSYFNKKNLIKYDMKTIKNTFIKGMDISVEKSKYCSDVKGELEDILVDDVGDDMDEILTYFKKLNTKLKEKMYKEKAESVFKCIPMKMEEFYERFDKECMKTPIFEYYDVFQMFQRISCASNEDIITIKDMLIKRAQKYGKKLSMEKQTMQKLKQVTENYIKGKSSNIKNVMLEELAKGLDVVLKEYEKEI